MKAVTTVPPPDAAVALLPEAATVASPDGWHDEPGDGDALPCLPTERVDAVLLPHVGLATREADMAILATRNAHAVLTGHPPLTPVPA